MVMNKSKSQTISREQSEDIQEKKITKRIKKYRCGRPRKQQIQQNHQSHEQIQYICQSPILSDIMEILVTSAQCKLITKVGQKGKEDKKNDFLQIQMDNKKGNENLKKFLEDNNIQQEIDVFFLRTEENKGYFEFQDGQLIDKTIYQECQLQQILQFHQNSISFVKQINLIFKQLSPEFIKVFQHIIQFYLEEKALYPIKKQNQITEELIEYIMQNEKKEMEYLLLWNELKAITKDIYVKGVNLQLKQRRNQIKRKSAAIQAKTIPLIEQKEEYINKIKSSTPIQYLISELVNQFELLSQEQSKDINLVQAALY